MRKENHKDMSDLNPPYVGREGDFLLTECDLSTSGALITTENGRPTKYVRGGRWRPEINDPVVRENDVKRIYLSAETPRYPTTHVGSELELFAWNVETGDLHPIMESGSSIVAQLRNGNGNGFHNQSESFDEIPEELNFSDELMKSQIEVNFRHSVSGLEHSLSQVRAIRKLTYVSEKNGAFILPISALPHRKLEKSDVGDHPYVRRIALYHMGWKNVRHFIGSSFQTHAEISDSETALRSINYLQQLTPGVLAISAASPFMNGREGLNHKDITGAGRKNQTWQSVRYPGRVEGSPSGGVISRPAPDSLEEYFNLAHQDLVNNSSPTVARVLGHHSDFRFRPDIGTRGTIEAAVADSFGGHPKKLAAMTELFRAQAVKIQSKIYHGNEYELPSNLFCELDQRRLNDLHSDSYSVSRDGLSAMVSNPNGGWETALYHFNKMLTWVNQPDPKAEYSGLPKGIVEELNKSAVIVTEAIFQEFDPSSTTFISGFYESSMGTLSQWLHRRVDHLRGNSGLSEKEAIVATMSELGYAYHNYIQNENLEQEVIKMFI